VKKTILKLLNKEGEIPEVCSMIGKHDLKNDGQIPMDIDFPESNAND
jgi:hypothetical protein